MIPTGTNPGAFAHHWIHPTFIIDTIWATGRRSPTWVPLCLPYRGAPSAFIEPLSWLIHSRLEALHTPSHIQRPTLFREPYPVANLLTAPMTFVHLPNPWPISGDNPLASMTWRFTPAEEEYLHTLQLTPPTVCDAPQVPEPSFPATPQPWLTYVPTWPTVQSGHCPLCQQLS